VTTAVGNGRFAFLDAERQRIDAVLEQMCGQLLAGADTVIASPILHAVGAGGKRLRPVLCVAAYRAAQGNDAADVPHGLYELACGLELLHTYSLMHDDLPSMDDDDLRRGRPTAHRVFGVAATTVAGAALIPLAARAIDEGARSLGLAAERRLASISELTRAGGAAGMVGGQMLDLEAEGRRVAIDALIAIHARKTGALFAAATRIGGIAATGDGRVVEALGRYGEALGRAFQIADDVLDETGSTAVLGKNAGKDRARAKATYPALLGLEPARQRARAALEDAAAALRGADLHSAMLLELARFAVERDR
jgi:geranylgeranyl diphosphate synthase, type II